VIRRLRMQEWRAFTDVEVDLDYPVVFFVAPNGVGKTSLYEAARCALFGFPTGRNAGQLVRVGAKRASLSVNLVLNGSDIRVTRTLTPGGRTTFDAELEGQSLDESAFESLMTSSWTADRALIDRLVFGDSSPGSGSAPLPVRAHLADLLGVTPLLEAADTLRAKQKSLATTISALREAEEDTSEASADAERKQRGDDCRELRNALSHRQHVPHAVDRVGRTRREAGFTGTLRSRGGDIGVPGPAGPLGALCDDV